MNPTRWTWRKSASHGYLVIMNVHEAPGPVPAVTGWRGRISRVVAWTITGALLYYVFSKVPFADVWDQAAKAAWWTIPVMVVMLLAAYVADAFAIWRIFGLTVAKLSFPDLLVVRGAAYLLSVVNYALGQGAIVFFARRATGVSLARGTGGVLLFMGANLLLLMVMVTIGALAYDGVPETVKSLLFGLYGALTVYAVMIGGWCPRILRELPVLQGLFQAGWRGHLQAMVACVPYVGALFILTVFACWGSTFGRHFRTFWSICRSCFS